MSDQAFEIRLKTKVFNRAKLASIAEKHPTKRPWGKYRKQGSVLIPECAATTAAPLRCLRVIIRVVGAPVEGGGVLPED